MLYFYLYFLLIKSIYYFQYVKSDNALDIKSLIIQIDDEF
jgi:hypothetical protein